MLSAEDLAAVKVAVAICNDTDLKNKILRRNIFPDGTELKNKIRNIFPEHYFERDSEDLRVFSSRKPSECEVKVEILVRRLGLRNHLQQKVIGIVHQSGMWMRAWVDYHARTLCLSRHYIANLLNTTLFTSHGMIDYKKAAEELLKDKGLSIKQQYKLACLYCFKKDIHALYSQMAEKDRKSFCDFENPSNVKQPELVTFWTYYILGKMAKLAADKHPYHYGFEVAVKSGNQVAAEYFLSKINEEKVRFHIICNALKNNKFNLLCRRHDRHVDVLYFLLLKMREDEQVEFLMEDISSAMFDVDRLTALHSLLYWPYQNYFMKLVNLMWGILPGRVYADLLLAVSDKVEPERFGLQYEDVVCDYRKLLNEYWCQSTEYYKNCIVSNELKNLMDEEVLVKANRALLHKLCLRKEFTVEDRNMFEMVFQSIKEKEIMSPGEKQEIHSWETVEICVGLIVTNNWKIAEEFLSHYLHSKEEMCNFKKQLMFTQRMIKYILDFVQNDKFVEVETCLRWSSLSVEEICQFKREVIHSRLGLQITPFLFFGRKMEVADRFVKWSFSSEEEGKKFKSKLIFSNISMFFCEEAILNSEIGLVDEYISFCLSSEEVNKFKHHFSKTLGGELCCQLISGYKLGHNGEFKKTDFFMFVRSEWERVDNFLSWCFSSDEEISDFKDEVLAVEGEECHTSLNVFALKREGSYSSFLEVMHLFLVLENSFDDVEKFYAWFNLSPEEIRQLKKEALLSELGWKVLMGIYREAFVDSVTWETGEKLKLSLRWCLIDAESVSEFKYRFDNHYGFKYLELKGYEVPEVTVIRLNYFYEFIEKLLTDLNQKSEKRKVCEHSTECLSKRHCTLMS